MSLNPIRVFVSYTAEDLSRHADIVVSAIQGLDMMPVDHRKWSATGKPSVPECQRQIASCQVLLVLVAHRFGWVPSADQGGDGERSITQIEVACARDLGLEVLPFIVEKDAEWRADLIEGYGNPEAKARLDKFKAELQKGIAGFFSTPVSLDGPVSRALQQAAEKIEHATVNRRAVDNSEPADDEEVILPWTANSTVPASLAQRLGSQLPKRILTIDDADMTAGATLGLLQRLQEILRIRYGTEDFYLADYYDLIVGVGWSSFMAAALALRTDVQDVEAMYENFLRNASTPAGRATRLLLLQYENANLREFLKNTLRERTLGSPDLVTGLLLVTTHLRSAEPFSFTNHPGWNDYPTWRDLPLADLVLASSTLPMMYQNVDLNPTGSTEFGTFLSGSASIGNNPSLHALFTATNTRFAFRWRLGRSWLSLTSLGGKQTRLPIPGLQATNPLSGLLFWTGLLPAMLSRGASRQARLMLEAIGVNADDGSSTSALAGNLVINYRRYELPEELEGSADVKPNPFEIEGSWREQISQFLRPQMEATRLPARSIVQMGHFRKPFDVRRPAEGL